MKQFKVFKKLCSLALILSMLVSMIPMNVFATTQSTIDSSKKGTLTITKYDSNYTEDDKETEEDETVKIPIPGVEFTIYEIFSITDENEDGILDYSFTSNFESFFSTLKIGEKVGLSVDEVRDMNGSELEALTEDLQTYITANSIEGTANGTTNIDGEVKFSDLSLGYYFVVETNYPDDVITAHQPFFVSVPQSVNTLDQENKVISSQWIYDIVAQPKNTTAYTAENSLTLTKVGLEDVKLQNAGFVLEKLNEDSEEEQWELVKLPRQLLTDVNGEIKVGGLTQGKYRFVEIIAPDGYILNTTVTYGFEVKWDTATNQLKYVYEGKESTSLNIKVTNEKPTVDKVVTPDESGDTDYDVKVEDTVNWTITATVPKTIQQLETFKLTDTLSKGLDYVGNLKVIQDGALLTQDEHYTLNVEGQKIEINFVTTKLTASKNLVVTYDTKVNNQAIIGVNGNDNKVVLDYSTSTGTSSTTTPTTPETNPKVYTFGLKLVKENNAGDVLEGAQFKLCTKDGKTCDKQTTDEFGILSFSHLEAGEYVLTEIKAPSGYNLLKEPINIVITANYANKELSSVVATANEESLNLIKAKGLYQGYFEITVLNQKGFQLPATGGMGTVIFTVAGLGIMGLAGAAYIALKRKESQK